MKQVTRKRLVQGAKHIIWDVIIAEAAKIRPYFDYILDKEIVMQDARQSVAAVKVLNENPIDSANNAISFLNGLTEDDLKTTNMKDRISVITWARKVAGKHQHLDNVGEKIDIRTHQVIFFIEMFTPLFKTGLPFFMGRKRWSVFPNRESCSLGKV